MSVKTYCILIECYPQCNTTNSSEHWCYVGGLTRACVRVCVCVCVGARARVC